MGVHRTKADKQKAALHRQQAEYSWQNSVAASTVGIDQHSTTVSSAQPPVRPSSLPKAQPSSSLSAVNRIIRVDARYLHLDLRRSLMATTIGLIALVGIWWWGRYNGVSY